MVKGVETLSVRKDTLNVLIRETYACLSQQVVDARRFRQLLGRWVWSILPVRPLFAVLSKAFRFAECARGEAFTLWPSVAVELRQLLALTPFLKVDMKVRVACNVLATDASLYGFGIMQSHGSCPVMVQHLVRSQCKLPSSAVTGGRAVTGGALRGVPATQRAKNFAFSSHFRTYTGPTPPRYIVVLPSVTKLSGDDL